MSRMWKPLDGLVPVCQLASRFEADLVAQRLGHRGITATVMADPVRDVAPYMVTQPGCAVVVRSEDAAAASALIKANKVDSPEAVPTRSKHKLRKVVGWALAATFVVPFGIVLVRLPSQLLG